MNVKITKTLLVKRHFIKFFFHFEGMLLAVRGCTSMFKGCSRTLKTPNSPPLIIALVTPRRLPRNKNKIVAVA